MTMWYKLTIVVPKTGNSGCSSTGVEVQTHVAYILANTFGGVTTQEAYGEWVDNNGTLIGESVFLVWCYVKDDYTTLNIIKHELAAYVKKELLQDCVLTSVEEVKYVTFHE